MKFCLISISESQVLIASQTFKGKPSCPLKVRQGIMFEQCPSWVFLTILIRDIFFLKYGR